jgi:hypothetical protein
MKTPLFCYACYPKVWIISQGMVSYHGRIDNILMNLKLINICFYSRIDFTFNPNHVEHTEIIYREDI